MVIENKPFINKIIETFTEKHIFQYIWTLVYFSAVNITIDTEGLLDATGRGFALGKGTAPGFPDPNGGSGGSHGGLGGKGNGNTQSSQAYSSVGQPDQYGSGGSTGIGPSDGGDGGGIIYLKALHNMEIDGDIKADGNSAKTPTAGGGSGGSIILNTQHFTGLY